VTLRESARRRPFTLVSLSCSVTSLILLGLCAWLFLDDPIGIGTVGGHSGAFWAFTSGAWSLLIALISIGAGIAAVVAREGRIAVAGLVGSVLMLVVLGGFALLAFAVLGMFTSMG
jgi:hypothetical protein